MPIFNLVGLQTRRSVTVSGAKVNFRQMWCLISCLHGLQIVRKCVYERSTRDANVFHFVYWLSTSLRHSWTCS